MIAVILHHSAQFQPLYDLVAPGWKAYCEIHGYTFVEALVPELPEYHVTFGKIQFTRDYMLENDCDYVFLVDCDMVCTNPAVKLETFRGYSIAMTADCNGINSGSLFLHCSDRAIEWLDLLWGMRCTYEHDQHAMNGLFFAEYVPVLLAHPSINSICYDDYPEYSDRGYTSTDGNWRPDHLLVHFPGKSLKEKITLAEKYLKLTS